MSYCTYVKQTYLSAVVASRRVLAICHNSKVPFLNFILLSTQKQLHKKQIQEPMKLTLFISALLATIVAAQKAEGDFIRISLVAGKVYNQLRIITEPRDDYSAEADKPSIWLGKGCESAEADVWVDTPVDHPSKCCMKEYLNNFKIWEEEQGVTLNANIYADHVHSDAFDGKCVNTTDNRVPKLITKGKTYNSYMVQAYKTGKVQEIFEYLIEFHK
jgi:hypothetical protein